MTEKSINEQIDDLLGVGCREQDGKEIYNRHASDLKATIKNFVAEAMELRRKRIERVKASGLSDREKLDEAHRIAMDNMNEQMAILSVLMTLGTSLVNAAVWINEDELTEEEIEGFLVACVRTSKDMFTKTNLKTLLSGQGGIPNKLQICIHSWN